MRTVGTVLFVMLLAEPIVSGTNELVCLSQEATIKELSAGGDLAKARELVDKSRFDEAEAGTREFLKQHNNSAEGHFLLGLIHFRRAQSLARLSGTYLSPGDVPAGATSSEANENKIRASLAEFTEGAKYGRPSAYDLKVVSLDY